MTMKNQQIFQLCERVSEKLPELLQHLKIDYRVDRNRLVFPCPIHEGDNNGALTIFTDGNSAKGNYTCWTHHCEEKYGKNILGFIKGFLESSRKKILGWDEVNEFALNFVGGKIEEFEGVERDYIEVFQKVPLREKSDITPDKLRRASKIASPYFLGRGYSPEVLDKFLVGDRIGHGKPMSGRAVVPVFDELGNYAGCLGRSVHEQISKNWPKWFNQVSTAQYLYGMYEYLKNPPNFSFAILTEGPADVWRLHEAGFTNSFGLFGASISDVQVLLLEKLPITTIVVMTDNDEAGESAHQIIKKKCGRRFDYIRPSFEGHDVGDLSIDNIKRLLIPITEKLC